MASQRLHNGGGTGPFAFNFPSLQESDIKVSVDGNPETGFTINNYDPVTGGEVNISGGTASGQDNVRIFRQTEPETLAATFVAGSSITANDLNNCNKQTIFLADENRTSINNLALGNAASAVLISGSNIADNSISSSKIIDLEVKTADINNEAVTTAKLDNDAVTADKLADSINAAIAANTAKVTNATHTGDVTGSTALTIADGVVTQAKLNSALLAALQTHFSNPVATVIWYAGVGGAGTPPPTGYLKANGDTIPNGTGTVQNITADFSALYALVGATLPDLRGEFIRGWDDGKGVDANRSFKSTQSDQWKNHQHVFGGDDMIASSSIGNFQSIGASGHFQYDATSTNSGNGRSMYTKNSPIDSGGTETRPRNVSLLACIKY